MQFLVIGYDGKDEQAPQRRQQARPEHIRLGDELVASGNVLYGAALLDADGEMIGSSFFMYFESREQLDAYLEREPYVTEGVWEKVEVHLCNTRNPMQFNRDASFFQERGYD